MEPWQRDIIKRNLPELVELTKWNTQISTTLTSKNVLSPNDVDSLDTCNRTTGTMACSQLLYSIVETRTTGFEGVASALHKARQTGAFNILLKGCLSHLAEERSFIIPCPETRFWMVPRNSVSLEIFDYCVGDLLVFKGISYDELCLYTKCGHRTSRHWEAPASDYLLLQDEIDFDEICRTARKTKRNVHLLQCEREGGGFRLVRSFGHVFNICRFLHGSKNERIAIQDFFYSGVTLDSSSRIRLIECDFQMWACFMEEMKKRNEKSAFGFCGWNLENIFKVDFKHKVIMAKNSTELVARLLDCSKDEIEELLYRDQIDECNLVLGILGRVEDDRLELLKHIIHKVSSEIFHISFWILTGTEVWRLERAFRVSAWEMQGPAEPERRLEFLPEAMLVSPAVQCELNFLSPLLPNENPYFSSPPVANLLKARNVSRGVNAGEICGEIFSHCANTLTLWLGGAASVDIQLELMKIGFRSLFPGCGGMVQADIQSFDKIFFVCEDIAAFAVAKLLVDDRYSGHMGMGGQITEFLRDEVFSLDEKRGFKNFRVCYFIDHFLGEVGNQHFLQILHKIIEEQMYYYGFIRGCILGRFSNLLKIISEKPESLWVFQANFYLGVAFGDVPILNYCKTNEFRMDILELGVKRGDLSVVSDLLQNYYNFSMRDYASILGSCVENSCLDSQSIISQKREIINQLLTMMRSKYKWSFPILRPRIHLQLFKHLLSTRVLDLSDTRFLATIIFETTFSHLTPGEFHELVHFLVSIERMIYFKIVDVNGWTAAHHVLMDLQILPETLDVWQVHGVDFKLISNEDLSLLSCAILGNQSVPVLKKLVECGADWNFKNKFENGLLHLAVFHGKLSAMMVLLEAGCDVSQRNIFGYAPIHLTFISESKDNFIDSLNLLLRYGADVDCRDASGATPLFWAVTKCKKEGWLDAVRLLVKRGAHLHAKDNDGQNILHRAASERSPEEYDELINWILLSSDQGNLLKEKCDFQCTPLHYAVLHLELMEATLNLLLKYGDINDLDKHGNSVLMYAIKGARDSRFLKMLMAKGVDWRKNNCRQFTVLHQAAKYGNVDALKLYFEKVCDVNSVTVDSETPLHVVFHTEHHKVNEVVAILLKKHADVKAKDMKGRTPLDLAKTRPDLWTDAVAALKKAAELMSNVQTSPASMGFSKPAHLRFPFSLLPKRGSYNHKPE